MKEIKQFDIFVKKNIVKKQAIIKSRAEFLIKESERDYKNLLEMVEKLGVNDINASTLLKSCYDTIMKLIRAKMLLEGLNATGFGAHEAEVSYMGVLGFNEKEIKFADQMRYFRNGTLYYGTAIEKEYAEKVIEFTKMMYPKLMKMVQDDK